MQEKQALGPLLGRVGHLARADLDTRLSGHDVTPVQAHVLLYLFRRGGQADQRDVTEFLRVKPSTANGVLDRMEEKGLLVRTVSGSDARRRCITLTALGRTRQTLFCQLFQEAEERMVRGFSEEELRTFRSMLGRMISNLEGEA